MWHKAGSGHSSQETVDNTSWYQVIYDYDGNYVTIWLNGTATSLNMTNTSFAFNKHTTLWEVTQLLGVNYMGGVDRVHDENTKTH